MRIHILGICGTFMAGVALIAKQQGHQVTGSDAHVYPPMSAQLAMQGIALQEGYHPEHLQPAPDLVIIGNALTRGNPAVEYVLTAGLPYISAPQWLAEQVLRERRVVAVAGTHGKTTTTSLLAWILEYAGLQPGFLIGGMANNFATSAQLGKAPFFVIEGDEYDSAFFDKRSKFLHYRPNTLILNNLEYDHAEIFADLAAIKQTFHFLLRTVPGNGQIIALQEDAQLQDVIQQGCWTPVATFGGKGADWQVNLIGEAGDQFEVIHHGRPYGAMQWPLLGRHNVLNALAALAAAQHLGVKPVVAREALRHFTGVKRRLEVVGQAAGMTVYDDFAHHPTAVAATLQALRAKAGPARIIAVLEFGSYTMRHGYHGASLITALQQADQVILLRPDQATWDVKILADGLAARVHVSNSVNDIIAHLVAHRAIGDHVVIMSNKGFGGIHGKLLEVLRAK